MSEIVSSHQPCPSCSSSDAYSTYDDGHGFCFSCNTYFPAENYDRSKNDNSYSYEYLPWRSISKETMAYYKVKTKTDEFGKPVSIGYRYPNGSFKVRTLDKKAFYSQGDLSHAGLFGRNLFDPGAYKSVTVTEGEADALACWQITRSPSVSVRSASSGGSDCARDYSWLSGFDRIYLCLDADVAGHAATANIAKLFPRDKLYHVRLGRHKDALGYLEAGEESEFLSIWNNAKLYLPEHTISALSDFSAVLDKIVEPGINYPFKTLQEMTYGLRGGESILLTAFEGVGKTEFLHSLEYSILRGTDKRIGAIFLEETPRRHLEALASIHLRRPVHLEYSDISKDQIKNAIREIVGQDDKLFMDTRFGSCDVRELNDYVRFLVHGCGCSIIILDHISMAVGSLQGASDERKDLDFFFNEQEMMVKELGHTSIIVSHVNDLGQTRGSRWGAKVADTWIHLSRELGSNILRVDLNKNRFGGKTGFAGNYLFNPYTREYTEVANDNDKGESETAKTA